MQYVKNGKSYFAMLYFTFTTEINISEKKLLYIFVKDKLLACKASGLKFEPGSRNLDIIDLETASWSRYKRNVAIST